MATDLVSEPGGTPSQPAVDIVEGPSLRSAPGYNDVVLAIRRLLRSRTSCRLVVGSQDFQRARDLLSRADDTDNALYRLDAADGDVANTVHGNEVIVFLHFEEMDSNAQLFHRRGQRCAHWMLGCPVERMPGRWPFLHETEARAYTGRDALNDWMTNQIIPSDLATGSD